MKKILIVFTVIFAIAALTAWLMPVFEAKTVGLPVAGGAPEDFTLGMSNSVTYRLDNFMGKKIIVLVFLDKSPNSLKFEAGCQDNLRSLFKDKRDLVWFNIKRDGTHAVITEQTKTMQLMYRAPYRDIPDFYNFATLPSVMVIDKTGTIKLIYNGYSPTIFKDILDGLPKAAK